MIKLPHDIQLIEVGPRDGFQNIKEFIPTDIKLKIIDKLINSGIAKMEVTSFVHPKAIPQMIDSSEVVESVLNKKYPGFQPIALVPNLYGAQSAFQKGIKEVSFVISVSEEHNMANIHRTQEQSFNELKSIKEKFPGLHVRIDAATTFGCPFSGKITDDQLIKYVDILVNLNVDEIILCDTIGVGNPKQVSHIVGMLQKRYPNVKLGLHMHDTRGLGVANTLAGIDEGVTIIESAVGGLGGCPFAPGASGNTATEDLLYVLNEMEVRTGINLEKYMEAVKEVKENIKNDLTSHIASVFWNNSICIGF